MSETRALEHVFVGGVAVEHGIAGLAGGAHALRVEIHRDVFESHALEHARNALAHAAKTADHDVFAPRDRLILQGLAFYGRTGPPLLTEHEPRNLFVVADEQRTRHHAEHDCREQRLHDVGSHESALKQQGQQARIRIRRPWR